jgi:zinc protease
MLMLRAMSNPAEVDRLVEACLAVTDSLAADGVGVEKLDRLREPMLSSRRDSKRTNGYWMSVLDGAQKDPKLLDSVRSADGFLENVGPQNLNFLATEHPTQKRASIRIVQPKWRGPGAWYLPRMRSIQGEWTAKFIL